MEDVSVRKPKDGELLIEMVASVSRVARPDVQGGVVS